MTATIADLRTGLADAISSLSGLRVYEQIPDAPVWPASVIELRGIEYDSTFSRGADDYTFSVTLISGRATDRGAQTRLEAWMAGHGSDSFKTAVETDPTLGGICGAVRVESVSGLQSIDVNQVPCLAVEFTVTLIA